MAIKKKLKAEIREAERRKELEKQKRGGTLSGQLQKLQVNKLYKKSPKKSK